MKIQNAISLMLVAGVAVPAMADRTLNAVNEDIHAATRMGGVYINAATNERVISLKDEVAQRPAARGGAPFPAEIWVADNVVPCAQFDPTFDGGFVLSLDNPAAPPVGETYLKWGDLPADTIVDGFLFSWTAQEPVANEGDGVPGLDAIVTFSDGDNGGGDCFRTNVLQITVGDLPGNSGQFTFEVYDITIDLNGTAVFEFGDTDGDDQGTGLHNPLSFVDRDLDGLHDWSYAIQTIQPNPATPIQTLLLLAAPRGEFASLANGDYIVDQSFPDGTVNETVGTAGDEDAWDIYSPGDIADPATPYLGTFGFRDPVTLIFGLDCDANDDGMFDGTADDYTPWGSFNFALYGPAGIPVDGGPQPCPADFNGDGVANFNDVVGFLGAFNSQLPTADFNGDGIINFNDVVGFLGAFNAGCP